MVIYRYNLSACRVQTLKSVLLSCIYFRYIFSQIYGNYILINKQTKVNTKPFSYYMTLELVTFDNRDCNQGLPWLLYQYISITDPSPEDSRHDDRTDITLPSRCYREVLLGYTGMHQKCKL